MYHHPEQFKMTECDPAGAVGEACRQPYPQLHGKLSAIERHTVNGLLRQSIAENGYTPLTDADGFSIKHLIVEADK